MPHTPLNSKADFDKALETKGKYVLVYGYEGTISDKADEYADKFASTTDAYSVDIAKHEAAKEYFGITSTPAVIVYKDGKELKKVIGIDEASGKEVAQILTS